MPIDFLERCDTIEECYEFMLAYAGQGLPSDATSPSGSRIRDFLQRAAHALSGIAASCADSLSDEGIQTLQPYDKFISVLNRDAQDSLAAIQVVLAQPSISSRIFFRAGNRASDSPSIGAAVTRLAFRADGRNQFGKDVVDILGDFVQNAQPLFAIFQFRGKARLRERAP